LESLSEQVGSLCVKKVVYTNYGSRLLVKTGYNNEQWKKRRTREIFPTLLNLSTPNPSSTKYSNN